MIVLKNLGNDPLGQYHIDVEMPARVIHKAEDQLLYVRDRSTRDRAFFRLVSDKHRPREVIYPGDERLVMSVHYFMDTKLFYSRGNLFDQPVTATLYQRGYRPVAVQRYFQELQQF